MRGLLAALVFAVAIGSAANAWGQAYPSRPVTVIVPYPPGGATDAIARVLSERLRTALGQPLVVENVGGAGGAVGSARAARSAPDGYTLVLGHVQTHVFNGASPNAQYDVVNDFEPVMLIADTPQIIITRRDFPANTVQELIAWMKANPGKATAGSVGTGDPSTTAGLYFQRRTGTSFPFVAYRGGGPLIQDVVGGHVDLTFNQAATWLASIRGKQVKALAMMSKERWWAEPEIPSIDEAGVPGLYGSFWHGLWAPKNTPEDVLKKIRAALNEAFADPTVQQRFNDLGQSMWPPEQRTPEALLAHQRAEIDKWWPLVKAAADVKPQETR